MRLLGEFKISIFKRPMTRRELAARAFVVAALALAIIVPLVFTQSGDSVDDIAGVNFAADLAALDEARRELSDLHDDPDARATAIADLEERVAELEERTFLGYLPRDGDAPEFGALIPDFRLLDLFGEPLQMSAIGRPAIVSFWASWCAFCVEEMPDFQRLHQVVGDEVAIIGINRRQDRRPLHDGGAMAESVAALTGDEVTLPDDLPRRVALHGGTVRHRG